MKSGGRGPGLRLTVLGIGAYLIFLLVSLPAAWLGFALERASGGALGLGEPVGTVWKGNGTLGLRSGGAYRRIADLEWSVNPLGAFTGRLNIALTGVGRDVQVRANVNLGAAGASFRNVEASVPAGILEPALPMVAFAKPDGKLRVQADSIEVGEVWARGMATFEWLDAGLAGLQAPRLGDYRLRITANGERAELQLATLRGDLRLNGQGEWRAAQPRLVQLRGVAEVAAERKDLESLLQAMGLRRSGMPQPFAWTVPIK